MMTAVRPCTPSKKHESRIKTPSQTWQLPQRCSIAASWLAADDASHHGDHHVSSDQTACCGSAKEASTNPDTIVRAKAKIEMKMRQAIATRRDHTAPSQRRHATARANLLTAIKKDKKAAQRKR